MKKFQNMLNKALIFVVSSFSTMFVYANTTNPVIELKNSAKSIQLYREINEQDCIKNPDGTPFCLSKFLVKLDNQNLENLDGSLYTAKDINYGGSEPKILFDTKNDIITIFITAKDGDNNYNMKGYAYRLDKSKKWHKELVFDKANYGWMSYFGKSEKGNPQLWHFSYYGYYLVSSKRNDDGTWSTNTSHKIQPDEMKTEYDTKPKALIYEEDLNQRFDLKVCGSRSYDAKVGITAEDFGNCDKIGTDDFVGLTLFKQNGKYFDLQCHNGSRRDYSTTGKNLINNFTDDKCWKALHLIPNSCELDNYRGQCNANKEPDGVGYQKHAYAVDIGNTNYQMYRGMFKNGQRNGHGSYYELGNCGFVGCGNSRTSGSAWFKDNKYSYDCTWNYKECESKPAREAEQARKEQQAYDRKVAAFRKNLKVGDDTSDGLVIEIKGNLIKIQTYDKQCSQRDYKNSCVNWINTPVEKWLKRSQIYPVD